MEAIAIHVQETTNSIASPVLKLATDSMNGAPVDQRHEEMDFLWEILNTIAMTVTIMLMMGETEIASMKQALLELLDHLLHGRCVRRSEVMVERLIMLVTTQILPMVMAVVLRARLRQDIRVLEEIETHLMCVGRLVGMEEILVIMRAMMEILFLEMAEASRVP